MTKLEVALSIVQLPEISQVDGVLYREACHVVGEYLNPTAKPVEVPSHA